MKDECAKSTSQVLEESFSGGQLDAVKSAHRASLSTIQNGPLSFLSFTHTWPNFVLQKGMEWAARQALVRRRKDRDRRGAQYFSLCYFKRHRLSLPFLSSPDA